MRRGVRSAIQTRARFSGLLVRLLSIRVAFSKRLLRRTSVRFLGFVCSQKSIIGVAIICSGDQFRAEGERGQCTTGKLWVNRRSTCKWLTVFGMDLRQNRPGGRACKLWGRDAPTTAGGTLALLGGHFFDGISQLLDRPVDLFGGDDGRRCDQHMVA